MNKEIKDKWTSALRSGEFKQGTGSLKRIQTGQDDQYCCLGVLTELAVREGICEWSELLNTHGTTGSLQGIAEKRTIQYYVLPSKVMKWADIDMAFVQTSKLDLVDLNDDKEYTFKQIADKIEKQL